MIDEQRISGLPPGTKIKALKWLADLDIPWENGAVNAEIELAPDNIYGVINLQNVPNPMPNGYDRGEFRCPHRDDWYIDANGTGVCYGMVGGDGDRRRIILRMKKKVKRYLVGRWHVDEHFSLENAGHVEITGLPLTEGRGCFCLAGLRIEEVEE